MKIALTSLLLFLGSGMALAETAQAAPADAFMTRSCSQLSRFLGSTGPYTQRAKFYRDEAEIVTNDQCYLSEENITRGRSPMFITAETLKKLKSRNKNLSQLRPLIKKVQDHLLASEGGFLWAENISLSEFEAKHVKGCDPQQMLFGEAVYNMVELCTQLEERAGSNK